MFMASALNVVAITLMPAMPGHDDVEGLLVAAEDRAEQQAGRCSGSTKQKNAAVGLRQNIRRSRRHWRQARPATLSHERPPRAGSAVSSR